MSGAGGGDTFVFNGGHGYTGYDKLFDFKSGQDKIMLDNMQLVDGTEITGFGDLDTNSDGVLDTNNQPLSDWAGTGYLSLETALIEFNHTDSFVADDFPFG